MLKRVKAAAVCAVALCALFALTGCDALKQETYTPPLKEATVSSPTIGQDGTLRVGVDTNKPPLAGMVSDRIVGIDVDIAAALADEMGLKLSIVDTGSNPTQALQNGTVDIVMGVDAADTTAVFWKSPSYLETGVAALSATEGAAAPKADANPTFAAQVSSKSAWAVMNAFGDGSLTSVPKLQEAFEALSAGTVQYVASDAIIGVYAAHGVEVPAHAVATFGEPTGYCIGTSASNVKLQTAVSDAIRALSEGGVIDVIEKKWLGAVIDLEGLPVIEAKEEEKEAEEAEGAEESESDGEETETPAAA